MKMPPMFNDAERAALRALTMEKGVDERRANIIADLSCLAVERSVEALMAVIRTTPDITSAMATTEIALQLAAQHYSDKASGMSKIAADFQAFLKADRNTANG